MAALDEALLGPLPPERIDGAAPGLFALMSGGFPPIGGEAPDLPT